MSSTEHYPEIADDESGLVPQQNVRPPEWPKKIRMLTAAELDRLMIDENGRFYWDGKPVVYDMPEQIGSRQQRSYEAIDSSALDITDRPASEEGEATQGRADGEPDADDARRLGSDRDPGQDAYGQPAGTAPLAHGQPTLVAPVIQTPEKVRVKMSVWQSLAMIVLVLGTLICASGIAAYGWVMAHDWGCRTGVIQTYCPPPPPAPKAPPRIDIPA